MNRFAPHIPGFFVWVALPAVTAFIAVKVLTEKVPAAAAFVDIGIVTGLAAGIGCLLATIRRMGQANETDDKALRNTLRASAGMYLLGWCAIVALIGYLTLTPFLTRKFNFPEWSGAVIGLVLAVFILVLLLRKSLRGSSSTSAMIRHRSGMSERELQENSEEETLPDEMPEAGERSRRLFGNNGQLSPEGERDAELKVKLFRHGGVNAVDSEADRKQAHAAHLRAQYDLIRLGLDQKLISEKDATRKLHELLELAEEPDDMSVSDEETNFGTSAEDVRRALEAELSKARPYFARKNKKGKGR